jgi:hypothetical protein
MSPRTARISPHRLRSRLSALRAQRSRSEVQTQTDFEIDRIASVLDRSAHAQSASELTPFCWASCFALTANGGGNCALISVRTLLVLALVIIGNVCSAGWLGIDLIHVFTSVKPFANQTSTNRKRTVINQIRSGA